MVNPLFPEEALWIRTVVDGLELPPGARVLDIGSSTAEYSREDQPHIEENVLAPLRERDAEVVSLDVRSGPGIDYTADITAPGFDPGRSLGGGFDLVLCNNLLVHLADLEAGARSVARCVAPGGYLLASTPGAYRRVRDPLDNGFRPSPLELAAVLRAGPGDRLTLLEGEIVRIDDRRYYRGSPFKGSWFCVGGRWTPVPAVVEQLRYLIKALRWRVSCVLIRRSPSA